MISTCDAAPKDDAISDFVSSIIGSFDNQSDFPDPSQFQAPLPPKGGYLTKFEFDVTQDGVPELFLRSSLIGKVNIYDISVFPSRLIAENITLGSEFGVIKDETSLALISCEGTSRFNQGFVRKTFRFQKSGDYTTQEFKIDTEAYNKIRNQVDQSANNGAGNLDELLLGTKDIIAIQRGSQILLATYINDRSSQWNTMHYVNGYGLLLERAVYATDSDGRGYIDPELNNDRTHASDFTLLAARSWLKSVNNTSSPNQNTKQTPATAAPTPKLPQSLQAPEATPAPMPSEKPDSSTPWSMIVVLIVAAIGLLWLLLKKRK